MCKLCLCFILLLNSFAGFAQPPGFSPAKNADSFKQAFANAAKSTNSIASDFVQEKNLSLLSDKITSTGKFWFKKENRVRMEYVQPFTYLMILNNGRIYVKDGQKENKVSASSNKLFTQVNRILVDCVGGTILSNPDFHANIFESPKAWMIELIPAAKNLQELYKKIDIFIDRKDYTATSIDMVELSGDNTNIRFLNKQLNAEIPDALFAIP
ncbi:MAG TPA: outer membrane lipoprotein carrier protein LolA [Puia sp.]|nr:outer membrane lipoprotein carrier protein LolA [Puia sp.]